jgi:uncharacterized membrane protein YfcA
MEATDLIGALVLGFAGGVLSGLLGVGGGVVFVPGLVLFLGESELDAIGTSLLAIVIVAVVGVWRQREYGNVRIRDGILIGLLAPLGVGIGAAVANAVPERALEVSFAAMQLYFAWRFGMRALRPREHGVAEG